MTFSLFSLPVLACAVVAFLLLFPYVQQTVYLIKLQPYKKQGARAPLTVWNFPMGLPWLFRLLRTMRTNTMPYDVLTQITESNRLTARMQTLGRFAFYTQHPENVKAMLATQFKQFGLGERHGQFFPLLGDGIFTLDGSGWSHSRALLRPQFSREQVSQLQTLGVHCEKLVNKLKEYPATGSRYLDVQEVFFELTIDTATEFLFGESVDLMSGGNPKIAQAVEFGKAFTDAQYMLTFRFIAQKFYPLLNSSTFQRQCEVCKSFTDSYVKLALQRAAEQEGQKTMADPSKQKYVFLDELVKETRDPNTLRDQSLNILLAGRDTTASLLSWVFYTLATNKAVLHTLRTAVLESFGPTTSDAITFESLKRCTYLRYVINETLRLYPTVPTNFRVAKEDCLLPRGGGSDPDKVYPMFVPKGAIVMYSAFVMHRLPHFWGPDAHEFKPERWYDVRGDNAHAWEYLPFNGGPRICLGQQFALTEASFAIVKILQSFKDIKIEEGYPATNPPMKSSLTLSLANGLPLQFVPA